MEDAGRNTIECIGGLQSESRRSLRNNARAWGEQPAARYRQAHPEQPLNARLAGMGHAQWQLCARPDDQLDGVSEHGPRAALLRSILCLRREPEISCGAGETRCAKLIGALSGFSQATELLPNDPLPAPALAPRQQQVSCGPRRDDKYASGLLTAVESRYVAFGSARDPHR